MSLLLSFSAWRLQSTWKMKLCLWKINTVFRYLGRGVGGDRAHQLQADVALVMGVGVPASHQGGVWGKQRQIKFRLGR